MTARDARRFVACLALLLALTSASSRARSVYQPFPDRQAAPSPVVYSAVVDSIIHPVSAEYMIDTIDQADRAGATLVVFTLRTPGGLRGIHAHDRLAT